MIPKSIYEEEKTEKDDTGLIPVQPVVRWGALWRSENNLDGIRKHLCSENGMPALFITRRQCRDWIKLKYGYIKERDDLREEPHGWRMPLPVKVTITPNDKAEIRRT